MICHYGVSVQIVFFFLIRGLQSYRPETTPYTYPPNATLLTSSEENQVYFKELEDAVHKFTLPGTVEQMLANYTAINTEGMQDRMNYVKEFIRNRNKKYYNNQTGLFETYHQRMAKVHEGMLNEQFEEGNNEFKKERFLNDELVARFLAHHPNVSFIPEMHAVTDYDVEYSGDRIKDDYEVKSVARRRRKRAVDEIETHVSNNYNEMEIENEEVNNMVKRDTYKGEIKINEVIFGVHDTKLNNTNLNSKRDMKYRENENLFRSGIVNHKRNVKYKRKNKRKRDAGNLASKEDLLKSLNYLALRNKFVESVEEKRFVKRSADDNSIPARKRELYKDYKSEWPYSKYESDIHADYIVPIPRRKKISSNYSKLFTPESSIFNSFYNDGEYELDKEKEKKKNLYRSMEYWTFTDPMAKYTSTPTIKYDKPYPTFGKNAATISVGASRFKLFNRNRNNAYKHRIHKRDVFGNNSTAVKLVHRVGHYISKVVLVYNTFMTFYFKSLYRYLRNIYYQSYFASNPDYSDAMLLDDPDYMEAVNRIANWSHKSFSTINPNLTFTILSQGNGTQTQYIELDWYTERYKDNSTQYFCDYLNDTYMLVNQRLKLYNKTIHQLIQITTESSNGSFENDYTFFDRSETLPPAKLTLLTSEEREKLLLNISASGNDKYLVVNNMSNPLDTYQASLNEILGRKKIQNINFNNNNTDKNNNQSLIQKSNKETLGGFKTQYGDVTDYQDDLFDKAADFVLSFFNFNKTQHKNGLNVETTKDDYTEMTNDLFDKIDNAAVGFFKICDNVSSASLEHTFDNISVNKSITIDNKSVALINNESTSNDTVKSKSYILQNKTENNKGTVESILRMTTLSFNSTTKRNFSSNILPINSKRIRSKRSLASRCLNGIKFVSHVFKPIEKHIVNVLDDIFGPYSSSNAKSNDPKEVKDTLSKIDKTAHSSDVLHKHLENVGSSLEEERSRMRDGSISGKSAIKKDSSRHSDESHRTKENSVKVKIENSLESNSELRTTRKKSKNKRKHKKKHHNLDNVFTDDITKKSDIPEVSVEKTNTKMDDPTLPSFIKHPMFGDTDIDNKEPDSMNALNTGDPIKDSKKINNKPSKNSFGDQMGNKQFPDYNYQQNPIENNEQFGNKMNSNTSQDYDMQNPNGKNQPFGNPMENNTFQDYDQQNPYQKNQPFGNPMGNNTFQDYDQQNPYGRNQPFGNQIDNNQQNIYGRNQPSVNQMGNNTFQDYDQQNPYGRNQPFGNPIGNNTFQDYDQQNPYGRNQPFGNPMGNNTLQDYDQQNPYGRNQPFGNTMGNNTFQDYDQQNPYGRNQPFGNPMGNNTFQDYDQQNPYGRNQPFGNTMVNNTFQDYNDPYKAKNHFPSDYNDQQNPYMSNKVPSANDTFPDYNNQQNLNDPGNPLGGKNLQNQTFPSKVPNFQFNQSNGLNLNGNYGDPNSPQLNGVNGFINNANVPVQNPDVMPPSSNLAISQALNNNRNGALQKYSSDPGNSINNVPQAQGQGGIPDYIQNNNLQTNQINQNLPGAPQQVNVTNLNLSNQSDICIQSEMISSSKMGIDITETYKANILVEQNASTTSSVTTEVSPNSCTTPKNILSPSVLNITQFQVTPFAVNDSFPNIITEKSLPRNISINKTDFLELPEFLNSTINSIFPSKASASNNTINCSKLYNSDDSKSLLLTSRKDNITFNIDDWFNNSNDTFDTNIFEHISSKPVLKNKTEKSTTMEINEISTKSRLQSPGNKSVGSIEKSISTETTAAKTISSILENLSTISTSKNTHEIFDEQKLEDVLNSFHSSNSSSINLKNVLESLMKFSNSETVSTTTTDSTANNFITSTFPYDKTLATFLTVNISGSPYVLVKSDSIKQIFTSQPNVLKMDIINLTNPFVQEPAIYNPYQMMNPPLNYFNPYQNMVPFQNPPIPSNNLQGQDYPLSGVNPFQELNVSLGPFQQVYPNLAQPPYPNIIQPS